MFANTATYNNESIQQTIGGQTNGWRKPLEDYIPAKFLIKSSKRKY